MNKRLRHPFQVLGRASSLFVGEDDFLPRLSEGGELVRQLISLATYASRGRFHQMSSAKASSRLSKGFLDVQAHTLAALKAWCHWLYKLHVAAQANPAYGVQCRELTSKVTLAAVIVIKEGGMVLFNEHRSLTS